MKTSDHSGRRLWTRTLVGLLFLWTITQSSQAQAPDAAGLRERVRELIMQAIEKRSRDDLPGAALLLHEAQRVQTKLYPDGRFPPGSAVERLLKLRLAQDKTEEAAEHLDVLQRAAAKREPGHWERRHVQQLAKRVAAYRSFSPEKKSLYRDCEKLAARVVQSQVEQAFDDARTTSERLLSLRQQLWGDLHPDLGISYYSRSLLLHVPGQLEPGPALMRRAVKMFTEVYSPDHPDVAMCRHALAGQLGDGGQLDESLKEARAATRIWSAAFGEDAKETTDGLIQEASILEVAQKHEERVPVLQRVQAIARRRSGEVSLEFADATARLAWALANAGKLEESKSEFQAARKTYLEFDEGRHAGLVFALEKLGLIEQALGDPNKKAIELMRASAEAAGRVYGPQSPNRGNALVQLGIMQSPAADSTATFEEAASVFLSKQGGGRLQFGYYRAQQQLGVHYQSANELEKARTAFTETRDVAHELFGAESVEAAGASAALGHFLVVFKRDPRAARPLVDEAVSTITRLGAVGSLDHLNAVTGQAWCARLAKEREREVALFQEVLELTTKLHGTGSVGQGLALVQLAGSQTSSAKHVDAANSLADAVAILRKNGRPQPMYLQTLIQLGEACIKAQHRLPLALNSLREAHQLLRKSGETDSERYREVLDQLTLLLDNAGEAEEAEPLVAELRALREADGETGGPAAALLVARHGSLQLDLGQIKSARQTLRQALKLYAGAGMSESPMALMSRLRLARAIRADGEPAAALPMLEQAVELAAKADRGSPLHLYLLNQLGFLCRDLQELTRGRKVFEERIALLDAAKTPNNAEIAETCSNLGLLLKMQLVTQPNADVTRDVLRCYERAVTLKSELGLTATSDQSLAGDTLNLAGALQSVRRLDEAEQILKKLLEDRRTQLPDGNRNFPDVAHVMVDLSFVYSNQNRFKPARDTALQAYELRRKHLGPDAPLTLLTGSTVVGYLRQLGQWEQAITLHTAVAEGAGRTYGENHARYGKRLRELAEIFKATGRWAEARQAAERAVAVHTAAGDSARAELLASQLELAEVLGQMSELASAGKVIEQAVTTAREHYGPKSREYADALVTQASHYGKLGDYQRALEPFAQATEILRADGEQNVKYLTTMNQYIAHTIAATRYDLTTTLCQAQLPRLEARFGRESELYIMALRLYALALVQLSDHALTQRTLNTVRDLTAKVFGTDSLPYADALQQLATFAWMQRDHARGDELFERSLAIRRKKSPDTDYLYRSALSILAAEWGTRPDKDVEPLLREIVEITIKANGERHASVAGERQRLALYLSRRGRSEEALAEQSQVLSVLGATSGRTSPTFADGLAERAKIEMEAGAFAEAEASLEEALAIRVKAHTREHAEVAYCLEQLGSVAGATGQADLAVERYTEALAIRERTEGTRSRAFVSRLEVAGTTMQVLGRLPESRAWLERALRLVDQNLGPDHLERCSILNALTVTCRFQGEFEAARTFAGKALEATRTHYGENHWEHAQAQVGLAGLEVDEGHFGKALVLLEAARKTLEDSQAVQDVRYASALGQAGGLYLSVGDTVQAGQLIRRALDAAERNTGSAGMAFAGQELLLALTLLSEDRVAEASPILDRLEPLMSTRFTGNRSLRVVYRLLRLVRDLSQGRTRGLAEDLATLHDDATQTPGLHPQVLPFVKIVSGIQHHHVGDDQRALTLLTEASDNLRSRFGPTHPLRAMADTQRAQILLLNDQPKPALETARTAIRARQRLVQATFEVLSERQKLAMLASIRTSLDTALAAESAADRGYQYVLDWKGLVTRSQRATSMNLSPEQARELRQVSSELAGLVLRPSAGDASATRYAELLERREALGRALAPEGTLPGQATVADLQSTLPDGTMLIDFIEYSAPIRIEGGAQRPSPISISTESRIAAFVVRAGKLPERMELGPTAEIAEEVQQWRAIFLGETTNARGEPRQIRGQKVGREADPTAIAKRMVPLLTAVRGADTVLISPDGPLTDFPFAALPGEKSGTFLLEDMIIGYVAAPADVPAMMQSRKPASSAKSKSGLLVVGDVDFGQAADGEAEKTATDWLRLKFNALAETGDEVESIAALFGRTSNAAPIDRLTGNSATEREFRRIAPDRSYVHLATHGFALAPQRTGTSEALSSLQTLIGQRTGSSRLDRLPPGVLSGVALSGANLSDTRALDNDGRLTGFEISSLDFRGTDLVVLSACSTGRGQATRGDGALGLQRAFQTSGARAVVASLWDVDDLATRLLMKRFYENLWERKLPQAAALRDAQLWAMKEARAGRLKRGVGGTTGRGTIDLWAGWTLSGVPGKLSADPD